MKVGLTTRAQDIFGTTVVVGIAGRFLSSAYRASGVDRLRGVSKCTATC